VLYTSSGSSDTLSTWFQTIPNNYNMLALQYIIKNSSYISDLQGIISPVGNSLQLNLVYSNNSGFYNIGEEQLRPYSWYYINISVIYPNTIEINVYSTTSELYSIEFHSILPETSEISVYIGNESFTQLFFISSPAVSSSPNLIYKNGYISNDTNYLSSIQWNSKLVFYYYLGSKYGYYYGEDIYPSFVYPSSYKNYPLVTLQSIVGFYN